MSRIFTEAQSVIPEAGTTVARIYQVIDLGEHEVSYKDEVSKKFKFIIKFELPNLTHTFNNEKGEQPFSIQREYNFSLCSPHKMATTRSHFSKLLNALGGKQAYENIYNEYILQCASEQDITKLINQYLTKYDSCMINIVHNDSPDGSKTYANIEDTMQLMKGLTMPNRINDFLIFDFYSNFENLTKLPEFIQNKITASFTYQDKKQIAPRLKEDIKIKAKLEELPTIDLADLPRMPF